MTEYTRFIVEHSIRWVIIASFVFIIGYAYTNFVLQHAPNENARRVEQTVKAVCDYSVTIGTTMAMDACYAAENTSNTEYICNATNSCWVEEH